MFELKEKRKLPTEIVELECYVYNKSSDDYEPSGKTIGFDPGIVKDFEKSPFENHKPPFSFLFALHEVTVRDLSNEGEGLYLIKHNGKTFKVWTLTLEAKDRFVPVAAYELKEEKFE